MAKLDQLPFDIPAASKHNRRTKGEYQASPPMPTANALKLEIEQKLATRFPAALTPATRTVREFAPVGIPEIDRLLDGGLPVAAISEIIGPASSGRTCLALSFLAQRTKAEQVCAWVDVGNALDPESAAACGVNLRRLLWVRCQRGGQGKYLDEAIKATEVLLHGGGFAAIVIDLGDLPIELGRRIPLSSWYCFRQAADKSRSFLVILGKVAYAQASAAVVLECSPSKVRTFGRKVLSGSAFDVRLTREKTVAPLGNTRKPPASTWMVDSAWDVER